MIIIATIETIVGSTFVTTEVEAQDYAAAFAQLRSSLPEGQRITGVRVER